MFIEQLLLTSFVYILQYSFYSLSFSWNQAQTSKKQKKYAISLGVGEDKIVSSYRSNTLKPIILKYYKKKFERKMFSHCINKLSSCHPNVLSVKNYAFTVQALCCDLCNFWTNRTCCSGKYKCYLLAHLAFRPCELFPSLFVRRPSVNISHYNLLLRNHWANCNQTLVESSLGGPLPKWCPVIPTSNQDGRQAKNRKRGDEIKNILSSETTEPISTKLCWNDPSVVPIQNCVRHFRPPTKMAATAELNLT